MSAAKRKKDTSDARKTIDELVVRYELNPDLRDIYVEGQWDRRVITWVFAKAGIRNVVVYDIDSVDIDSACLQKHSLLNSKKGRVVALAIELGGKVNSETLVTCLADKDYDTLLGKAHDSPFLVTTDYSTQEAYFLNEEVLGKFMNLVVGGTRVDVQILLRNVLPHLQFFHTLRATNQQLAWGMKWLSPGKRLRIRNMEIELNQQDFISSYLSKNARLSQRQEFAMALATVEKRLSQDPLNHVSKNDIFYILAEWLVQFSNEKLFHNPEFVARCLAACAEYSTISEFPMYKFLLSRYK